jgi:adenine-specific DNA-methyltransferase
MNNTHPYGPDNPHPLSQIKTELVWDGKYDEYGNRRPVRLPSTPLPLQRIETIDEPRDRSTAQRLPFDEQRAHRDDFRNMLIWGDNKLAMAALLEQFRAQVDLIYIDPPFAVGADFTLQVQIGEEGDEVLKEHSLLEEVAYRDTWGRGTDSYLQMMYECLTLMRELLSETGSIYVHLDDKMVFHVKVIMDEVFGPDKFRNCITRRKCSSKNYTRNTYGNTSDYILFYTKGDSYVWHRPMEKWTPERMAKEYPCIEEGTGRRYKKVPVHAPGTRRGQTGGPWRGMLPPSGKHWQYIPRTLDEMNERGEIYWSPTGNPRRKVYLDESDGVAVQDIWLDYRDSRNQNTGTTGYPTEKNRDMLARIIQASSNPGDLILDCFCGSGTTPVVAEKLGRRWIACDMGRYAIHTTRKRLIQVQRELHAAEQPYRSFDVYNLGRYERQWWQLDRLKGADDEHRRVVLRFYKAVELANPPSPLLHGKREGVYVHVDEIDGMLGFDELQQVAVAAQAAGARELHCLAWEFEMELAHKKEAIEAETGLTIRLKYIPREIMEPNRDEVQFFEAGHLQARAVKKRSDVDVELVHFVPALAEVPEREMEALRERVVRSPFDFIDFWAVDFEWREGKPFEHHWQDFRTRRERSLRTKTDAGWQYQKKGNHQICVKVIDVFGVDTTTIIDLEV